MITGEKILRQVYPNLDDKQYQPAGIDLRLGKVMYFDNDEEVYGIANGVKQLPSQKLLPQSAVKIDGTGLEVGYTLDPGVAYIGVTKEKIKISENCGQFYLPRSSLLRAGVNVCTAFGDPGFHGHLSFLLINHNSVPFFIGKDERFAQLIDMQATSVENEYDGDYNE